MGKIQEYICFYCKEKVKKDKCKEEKIENSSRYRRFHNDCYDKHVEEKEVERRQAKEYRDLIDYICKLYKIKAPTTMILSQLKNFKNEYGLRYKGIELSLRYFHDTLDNPIGEDGIGIVPYVYDRAKEHFIKQIKIAESIGDNLKNEEVTVYIDTEKSKRKSKKIDISAI